MFSEQTKQLPISEVLDQIKLALSVGDEAVLQAPPGAGKTTIVPLALLDESWLYGRKILVLEPRRVAARAAAQRMAQLFGEPLGQTVGYRIRLENCVSENTRIEVITEGILTRRLQSDPGLEDVGLVIFDEFHERNLDSDLCLALALQGRQEFREGPPLKLLVMSATLDGEAVADLLNSGAVISSEGRQFPVETVYGPAYQLRDSIVVPIVATILQALEERQGSILVFLPGQREIGSVSRELNRALDASVKDHTTVLPLYGGLPLEQQRRAIQAASEGQRKVVLSTNLAETSLTIEGVDVVVDSGLVREGVFDSGTGMTRLTTRRVSRASAEQRQGRAGRLRPGVCYRMWSEQQHQRLVAYGTPEILQADLAPMALQLMSWGVQSSDELSWLNPPPRAQYDQAVSMLEQCGGVFKNDVGVYQLTPHGVRLAQMPLHPRLAHMLLVGCDIHATETACLLAAILSERNPLSVLGVDIQATVAVLMGESPCPSESQGWFKRIWKQARRFARLANEIHKPRKFALAVDQSDVLGVLLASAYPDRIAHLREGETDLYQLSNGRSAGLSAEDTLAGSEWLAAAEIGGTAGQSVDRIYSAGVLNPATFQEILSSLVSEEEHVEWDYRNERFVAESHRRVGNILLSTEAMHSVSDAARGEALLGVVRKKGLSILPWHKNLLQWRARIIMLHGSYTADDEENPWPDFSDDGLLTKLEEWLLPYLDKVRKLEDFQNLDLKSILRAQLPWPLPLELERLAPERWAAPSGSSIEIDYTVSPPVLAVKLQEMFGCKETPSIVDGRVSLVVHLLSPAQRPLQITQDLAGFWRSSYQDVKREMKGRYPKHPWPDDPLSAVATRHTKRKAGIS
ncbi:MAG: ATP-dependent helicase HrpB [Halioglobus sp.]|jgi:ATP-dependent helicase HrpB